MFRDCNNWVWNNIPEIIVWFSLWNLLKVLINQGSASYSQKDPAKERQTKILVYAILFIVFTLICLWK